MIRGFSSPALFCMAALDQKTFPLIYIYIYICVLALVVKGSICIELIVSLTSWISNYSWNLF